MGGELYLCLFKLLQWVQHGDGADDASATASGTTAAVADDDEAAVDEDMAGKIISAVVGAGEPSPPPSSSSSSTAASEHERSTASIVTHVPDPPQLEGRITLHPFQRQALSWMVSREGKEAGPGEAEGGSGNEATFGDGDLVPHTSEYCEVRCEDGPVIVSGVAEDAALDATDLGLGSGQQLWERRCCPSSPLPTLPPPIVLCLAKNWCPNTYHRSLSFPPPLGRRWLARKSTPNSDGSGFDLDEPVSIWVSSRCRIGATLPTLPTPPSSLRQPP